MEKCEPRNDSPWSHSHRKLGIEATAQSLWSPFSQGLLTTRFSRTLSVTALLGKQGPCVLQLAKGPGQRHRMTECILLEHQVYRRFGWGSGKGVKLAPLVGNLKCL